MSSYLITGATGYIGSMLVKHIRDINPDADIILPVRNKRKVLEFGFQGVKVIDIDLLNYEDFENINLKVDYIFHCASVTKSKDMVNNPVEVIQSIVNLTQNIMNFAVRVNVKSIVYLSSMEVYGIVDCTDGSRITEERLGDINILCDRSCYPMGKRMAENICYSYFKEYNLPVKIARLAQTFGKGVLKEDNRVFMQLAKSVRDNKDIVLHTKGKSIGNYCGISDVVDGLMTILEYGKNGEAYNIVNEENTMSIYEMARFVCEKVAFNKISVIYDIPDDVSQYGYAADTGLKMSGKKLMKLGWRPTQTILDMYNEVIKEISDW